MWIACAPARAQATASAAGASTLNGSAGCSPAWREPFRHAFSRTRPTLAHAARRSPLAARQCGRLATARWHVGPHDRPGRPKGRRHGATAAWSPRVPLNRIPNELIVGARALPSSRWCGSAV
jgi:hypothetical protein